MSREKLHFNIIIIKYRDYFRLLITFVLLRDTSYTPVKAEIIRVPIMYCNLNEFLTPINQ